ncbi:hypothetical protein [Ahrensia kielensis]|uniref:hypothetical protein n=1 Tax=Ahrensia kielensis TaxID=76980 RepID=UPI000376CFF8|nr:hypothetical protein [Ahrensia kielensis]
MLPMIFKTTVATAIISTFATSAFAAIDGQTVLDRLAAQLELQGITVNADSVSVEGGDDVVLKGVTLKYAETDSVKIDSFILQDVIEAPNDGYIVGRIGVPGFETNDDDVKFSFGGVIIEGYFIAGPNETDPILKGSFYRNAVSAPIKISRNGKTIFSAGKSSATISDYQPGGKISSDMVIEDLFIDFTATGDAKTIETMKALNYEQINGTLEAKGTWDLGNGDLILDPMIISAEDAADLTFRFEVGGYTTQLATAMQEMQKANKDNDQQMGLAMLGMMQQLDINSASITIDDKSLTGRLIDFFGAQQGMNRESTVAFAKGMLPLGLAQLGDPDFAAKASAAIGQYLDNPKSLTISAAPASPVPVAQLIAAATSNPASLISALSLKLEANK